MTNFMSQETSSAGDASANPPIGALTFEPFRLSSRVEQRFMLVLLGAVLLAYMPTLFRLDKTGREDWDYFNHHYEAIRITVLEYGQYPWWNPWNCGGMPLATNPQIAVESIFTLCSLVFGQISDCALP